jgi:hypothetical protein
MPEVHNSCEGINPTLIPSLKDTRLIPIHLNEQVYRHIAEDELEVV